MRILVYIGIVMTKWGIALSCIGIVMAKWGIVLSYIGINMTKWGIKMASVCKLINRGMWYGVDFK